MNSNNNTHWNTPTTLSGTHQQQHQVQHFNNNTKCNTSTIAPSGTLQLH